MIRHIYKYIVCLFCVSLVITSSAIGKNVTEGVINTYSMSESDMKNLMIKMLVRHVEYAQKQYHSIGTFHYFGTGQSNEHGARTNADYAFVCAFLYKYGGNQSFPCGLKKEDIKQMAIDAIIYAYSTHISNKLTKCTDLAYWGSSKERYTWESSLWAESIGYASFLLSNELTPEQQHNVKMMITAEADNEVSRTIPTGYISDTKAEENGWDTNVLSLAVSLYPNDSRADKWIEKCKEFAMNSYSTVYDKSDSSKVDGKRVMDWYIGKNLYDDYTLENHDFFHTSYQNIVIQELSESYLAYRMMQHKYSPPESLKHNVLNVWEQVLSGLALSDGELAMPNGNDWSMYLYDQLASYAALATIYQNKDAYMLEQMALKFTAARQQTTSDGAFMLHPDINERRMAVTARRIAFAYLYHQYYSTGMLQPSSWGDFDKRQTRVKQFKNVGVTYARSSDRFASFVWMKRKKSFMGMIATTSPDKNKIWIPYKRNNTGNFTGFLTTNISSNAHVDTVSFQLSPNSFSTTGTLLLNQNSMKQYLAYFVTPGNAVIYQDEVTALNDVSVIKEEGIPMGVSIDPFTSSTRVLYTEDGAHHFSGESLLPLSGNWVNIDNQVGVVYGDNPSMAIGPKNLINSIYTSLLYGKYNDHARVFKKGATVTSHCGVFYSNVTSLITDKLSHDVQAISAPVGWKGIFAPDTDGSSYFLISNFYGDSIVPISLTCKDGAPVFSTLTDVSGVIGKTHITLPRNSSLSQNIKVFISSASAPLQAMQDPVDSSVMLVNNAGEDISVVLVIVNNGIRKKTRVIVKKHSKLFVNK